MSVGTCLGFDDPNGPPLEVAVSWQRWCLQDPDLAVVDDLVDLPKWTREADAPIADRLLARLHALAQCDAEAASVLAWLLLPGACSLANRLADRSTEIDALVAGALWVRVRTQPTSRYVAITMLRDVRRAVLVDLGIGDAARRADPVWARTTTYDDAGLLARAQDIVICAESESGFLVQSAVLDGAITAAEAGLLLALARTASELGATSRRGRAGLTSPAVIDDVTRHWPMGGRTVRRRVGEVVDRLGRFSVERHVEEELLDFVSTHDLPPVELDEFLELYLWDHIEEYVDGIRDECDESA